MAFVFAVCPWLRWVSICLLKFFVSLVTFLALNKINAISFFISKMLCHFDWKFLSSLMYGQITQDFLFHMDIPGFSCFGSRGRWFEFCFEQKIF